MNTRFAHGHLLAAAIALAAIVAPAFSETLADLSKRTHYHGLAFARAGSAVLILATHHGIFAVAADGTATRVSPVHDFMGFSPDPSSPLAYYASGHPQGGGNSGFLQSVDGGRTWKRLSDGVNGPVDFHNMAVGFSDPKTVYGLYGSLQVSRDGGITWAIAGTPPDDVYDLAVAASDPQWLFVATQNGLWESADAGATWKKSDFPGEPVSAVETSADGAVYAFVYGRGLMKSSTTGAGGWTLLFNGFGESVPLHIAIKPDDPRHLALATNRNEVFESRDGGARWHLLGATPG